MHHLPPLHFHLRRESGRGRDQCGGARLQYPHRLCLRGQAGDSTCIGCGQCIVVCPTAALVERDDTEKVWAALDDPTRHVVVQTAPSVRAALGEEFGLPIGTNVQGKMVAALRRLGFDGVFDTDFAADMTIMEEAHEFLERVKNGGKLPLITSCSPGWVKYCETFHPDFIPNLSSCKSPQQNVRRSEQDLLCREDGAGPRNVYCVSVMPCTAKKFEIGRPDQSAAGDGIPDVDVAITTRELARMIHRSGLRFNDLPDEDFDPAMGQATGAGHIFGATGGVMEAALRTAVETLTGEKVEPVEFTQVRGTDAIKEAEYQVARAHPAGVRGQRHRQRGQGAGHGAQRGKAVRYDRGHGLPRRLCEQQQPAHPARPGAQLHRHPRSARQGPV